jgi:hypothetical protein
MTFGADETDRLKSCTVVNANNGEEVTNFEIKNNYFYYKLPSSISDSISIKIIYETEKGYIG